MLERKIAPRYHQKQADTLRSTAYPWIWVKAKTSGASADAQIELNKQIEALEGKIEEGKTKLAEIADASDDTWEESKDRVESAWDSMKSAFSEAADKFKK